MNSFAVSKCRNRQDNGSSRKVGRNRKKSQADFFFLFFSFRCLGTAARWNEPTIIDWGKRSIIESHRRCAGTFDVPRKSRSAFDNETEWWLEIFFLTKRRPFSIFNRVINSVINLHQRFARLVFADVESLNVNQFNYSSRCSAIWTKKCDWPWRQRPIRSIRSVALRFIHSFFLFLILFPTNKKTKTQQLALKCIFFSKMKSENKTKFFIASKCETISK